jgi:fibronectin type 3 domain-containing protein
MSDDKKLTPPPIPTDIAYTIQNNIIELTWKSVPAAKEYLVYRQELNQPAMSVIATTTSPSYADAEPLASATTSPVSYAVSAINVADIASAPSKPLVVRLPHVIMLATARIGALPPGHIVPAENYKNKTHS